MAMRRQAPSMDGYGDDDPFRNPLEQHGGEGGPGIGGVYEPAPDFGLHPQNPLEPNPQGSEAGPGIGGIFLPPPFNPEGTPGPGNTDTSRELFDRRETTDGLPRGMTVQAEEGYGSDFGGQESIGTPSQSFAPNPVSARRSSPDVTQRVSSGGAPSALFANASGGTPMFGRQGGLTGGGKGVFGSNEGTPSPTEMMLKLVRMYQNGG